MLRNNFLLRIKEIPIVKRSVNNAKLLKPKTPVRKFLIVFGKENVNINKQIAEITVKTIPTTFELSIFSFLLFCCEYLLYSAKISLPFYAYYNNNIIA